MDHNPIDALEMQWNDMSRLLLYRYNAEDDIWENTHVVEFEE